MSDSKILRYLGLCEEKEFLENPVPDAVMHLDIASAGLDVPADAQMIYDGGLTRGPNLHRPNFYVCSGSIAYAFDIRTIGYLLKWALGGYSFDEDSPLNKHSIWGGSSNELDSFCARLGKDVFEHVFSGCVINTLTINVEGEYCRATADIRAAKDKKADLRGLNELLLPGEAPLAFYEAACEIAEKDESAKVQSFTLEINNNIGEDSGRTIGTRYPRLFKAGERTVTVSSNLIFSDTAELERFWGGYGGPADTGTEEFKVKYIFDSGEHGNMEIVLPRFIYTSVGQQPSGRDALIQPVSGRAFLPQEISGAEDTDIQVELNNKEEDMELAS